MRDRRAGALGGEEFLLMLPGATPEQAAGVVERIRAQLAALAPGQTLAQAVSGPTGR